jgi:hypothetical protein
MRSFCVPIVSKIFLWSWVKVTPTVTFLARGGSFYWSFFYSGGSACGFFFWIVSTPWRKLIKVGLRVRKIYRTKKNLKKTVLCYKNLIWLNHCLIVWNKVVWGCYSFLRLSCFSYSYFTFLAWNGYPREILIPIFPAGILRDFGWLL